LFFVLSKTKGDSRLALFWGAVFGFVLYGFYDFTNYSLISNWPFYITIIDFIWGIVLCSLTSLFANFMNHWLS
jgi:uncharacterized membrane protein